MEFFYQPCEGHLTVGVSFGRHLAHTSQQLEKGRVTGHVHPQHKHVEQVTNYARGLHPVAICVGCANDEIALSGVAIEQHVVSGEQRHKESRILLLTERFEPGPKCLVLDPVLSLADKGLINWSRSIGRDVEDESSAGQLLSPIREAFFQSLSFQPLALP